MLFRVGKIIVGREVLDDSTITVNDLVSAFERYLKGDWGIVNSQSGLDNDLALTSGEPVVASYRSATGTEFCMATENGQTRIFTASPDSDYGMLSNKGVWGLQAD